MAGGLYRSKASVARADGADRPQLGPNAVSETRLLNLEKCRLEASQVGWNKRKLAPAPSQFLVEGDG